MRDAERKVSIHQESLPTANSISLPAQLLGKFTSPSKAGIRAERRVQLQDALNTMEEADREILALKHFEQLTTSEIGDVLGLSKSGAGSRYVLTK